MKKHMVEITNDEGETRHYVIETDQEFLAEHKAEVAAINDGFVVNGAIVRYLGEVKE